MSKLTFANKVPLTFILEKEQTRRYAVISIYTQLRPWQNFQLLCSQFLISNWDESCEDETQ